MGHKENAQTAEGWTTADHLRLLISVRAAEASDQLARRVPTADLITHPEHLAAWAWQIRQASDELLGLAVAYAREHRVPWADIAQHTGGGTASAAQQRHTTKLAQALATAAGDPAVQHLRSTLQGLDDWATRRFPSAGLHQVSNGLPDPPGLTIAPEPEIPAADRPEPPARAPDSPARPRLGNRQLNMLLAIHTNRVHRAWVGPRGSGREVYRIGGTDATTADRRTITTLIDRGLVDQARLIDEDGMVAPVYLTLQGEHAMPATYNG